MLTYIRRMKTNYIYITAIFLASLLFFEMAAELRLGHNVIAICGLVCLSRYGKSAAGAKSISAKVESSNNEKTAREISRLETTTKEDPAIGYVPRHQSAQYPRAPLQAREPLCLWRLRRICAAPPCAQLGHLLRKQGRNMVLKVWGYNRA